MRRIRHIIALGALLCLCLTVCGVKAAGTESRVLFISSYSYAWEMVQLQIQGIQEGLQGLDGEYTLDYEFMDTKRVDDEKALSLFYEGLKYRLSESEPYDVVILGDDAALIFALEHQEELFGDTPLVFEGVNDGELAREAIKDSRISGVLESLSVEKNIELGLRLKPEAKNVVAILDNTLTGEAERKRFYQCAEEYPQLTFSEINTSELTAEQLRRSFSAVPDDSILIYVVMTEDADGYRYTNSQAIRMIVGYADVPVLRMVEGNFGEGIIGGNVVSMRQTGELAAQMAIQAMTGVWKPEAERLIDSPNVYCIDADVMKKFGISLSVLPEDVQLLNYEQSFFERNREAVVPGGVLIGALVTVILGVCIDNRRRRKLVRELKETKKIVEAASEHDFLTGIPNRSRFMADLQKLVEEHVPCTVMMVDIDDFKKINDTMGHNAGDAALQQIAARLKALTSQILMPYRFAGDEFILILRSEQSKLVEKLAFQCSQVFAKPFDLDGKKVKVCGSIGIASYPKDTEELEQLIAYADDAMYQVKKNGKNNFAYYNKELQKAKQQAGTV